MSLQGLTPLEVAPGGDHPAVQKHGLAAADEDGGEHIHPGIPQLAQGEGMGLLPLPADVADVAADRVGRRCV